MTIPPTPLHSAPDEEVVLPSEPMSTNDIDLNPDLEESDLDVASESRITAWTVPFEDAYRNLKQDFYSKSSESLSHGQQSRFVSYTDGEILQIQRKFIKFQANPDHAYPLEAVLTEVGHVMDFIWHSVNVQTELFGQEEYYLRILGDLEEWLEHYTLPAASQTTFYMQFFCFFQTIDTHVSFLVDGYETEKNSVSKLSTTVVVRLSPLVTRLRLLIITKISQIREESREESRDKGRDESVGDVMDLEIGRLFEGLLDRV